MFANIFIHLLTFRYELLHIGRGHWVHEHYWKLKLMKKKALRKHSLHEKTAASVLLKLFISSNEKMPHHWKQYWKINSKFVKFHHKVAIISLGSQWNLRTPIDFDLFPMGYFSIWMKTGIFPHIFILF